MQVKVFRSEYRYISEDDYAELLKGVTDWEEVSEADIKVLEQSQYTVVRRYTQPEIEATVAELVKIMGISNTVNNNDFKKGVNFPIIFIA